MVHGWPMQLALPKFQYRFIPSMGNVIYPGNFHPVGTQRHADGLVDRAMVNGPPQPGAGGRWLLVGGSGGFGSGARVALGARHGAHTLNVSLDLAPNPESSNKVRKVGSPGFHRNLAIERRLRAAGLTAKSLDGDAFDPKVQSQVIQTIRDEVGQLDGLVWALAAPRARDPRTGAVVSSALKPCGHSVSIKTFSGRDEATGEKAKIGETEVGSGTPEEAIGTIFVMGGGIVGTWIEALLAADVLAQGFTLYTISYRGSPLNAEMYRDGLIGLAKADLEFTTRALDSILQAKVSGRALTVEGPAVVTEASGGIPGVPFYMALLMEVLGERFEDPLDSMTRLFHHHFQPGDVPVDDEGLVRLDDRELSADVQGKMQKLFADHRVGDSLADELYDRFMTAYAQTRGFAVSGVDYEAAFEVDDVIRP